MQKQKVFIPVNVKNELPEMDKRVIVFGEQLSSNPQMGGKYPFVTKRQDLSRSSVQPDRMQDDNKFMYARYVSDWLKEQEGYFFTAEELKQFAIKVFEGATAVNFSGRNKKFSDPVIYPEDFKNIDRKEYIQSLNIK